MDNNIYDFESVNKRLSNLFDDTTLSNAKITSPTVRFNDISIDSSILNILFELDKITEDYRNMNRSTLNNDGTINKVKASIKSYFSDITRLRFNDLENLFDVYVIRNGFLIKCFNILTFSCIEFEIKYYPSIKTRKYSYRLYLGTTIKSSFRIEMAREPKIKKYRISIYDDDNINHFTSVKCKKNILLKDLFKENFKDELC